MHTAITRMISVLEWQRFMHDYAIGIHVRLFQYFYHVSDRRVQCAILTKNHEMTVFFYYCRQIDCEQLRSSIN